MSDRTPEESAVKKLRAFADPNSPYGANARLNPCECAGLLARLDEHRCDCPMRTISRIAAEKRVRAEVREPAPSERSEAREEGWWHEYTSPDIGTRIMAIRGHRKMTQEALAERTGLSQSTISMIENGERKPSWETAERLAEALGATLSFAISHPQATRAAPVDREPAGDGAVGDDCDHCRSLDERVSELDGARAQSLMEYRKSTGHWPSCPSQRAPDPEPVEGETEAEASECSCMDECAGTCGLAPEIRYAQKLIERQLPEDEVALPAPWTIRTVLEFAGRAEEAASPTHRETEALIHEAMKRTQRFPESDRDLAVEYLRALTRTTPDTGDDDGE